MRARATIRQAITTGIHGCSQHTKLVANAIPASDNFVELPLKIPIQKWLQRIIWGKPIESISNVWARTVYRPSEIYKLFVYLSNVAIVWKKFSFLIILQNSQESLDVKLFWAMMVLLFVSVFTYFYCISIVLIFNVNMNNL